MRILLATILIYIPFLNVFAAESFTGRVVRIVDGDSIVVLHNKQQIDVRLEGIDCPEAGQAFGDKAKHATSELAFGKTVTVKVTGKDRYERTLGVVVFPDEMNLNQELVRRGFAWWFRRYSDDEILEKLESEARKASAGLWGDASPTAPWDWRAARRAKVDKPIKELEIVRNGIRISALLPNPRGQDSGNERVEILNSTLDTVSLRGWKLIDEAGNVYLLSGSIQADEATVITMTESTMPLNNTGDVITLMDEVGVARDRVNYLKSQAGAGAHVRFD